MQNTQNNKAKKGQNVSRETLERIIISDIEEPSKLNLRHYLFALEVTSKEGIRTYFALNNKNLCLLYDLGLIYRTVIIVSENPIIDENGCHIKTYKNILNMARARYENDTDFSLYERLSHFKYVRQHFIDDMFLNFYVHR